MTSSLLATLQEPGKLRITLQPVFELDERPNPIYALNASLCGPRGTIFENSKLLLQYVESKDAEPLLDRVCLRLACEAMVTLPKSVRIHVSVHASTLALGTQQALQFLLSSARTRPEIQALNESQT